jgi:hypothetical protein
VKHLLLSIVEAVKKRKRGRKEDQNGSNSSFPLLADEPSGERNRRRRTSGTVFLQSTEVQERILD